MSRLLRPLVARPRVLAATLSLALGWTMAAVAEDPAMEEAQQRIAKHRQADAQVVVVDTHGEALPGVEIGVEQTRHQFLFGCNFFRFGRWDNPADEEAYRHQFADLFNFATLGFYWPSYEPRQGEPRHAYTQDVATWCRNHGITVKGHPLAWNYFEPRWLPEDLGVVRELQMQRISDCVTRFRGLIDIWDVVNEATHYERDELQQRAPKLTRLWTDVGRVPFVNECFRNARAAHEQATLLINDYRVDPAYADLISNMEGEAGARPYDVIGIQSHMHGEVWDNAKIAEVCDRFAVFGVPVHFTELTILSGAKGWELAREGQAWPSTPEGEAEQARDVSRIYTLLFSHPAVAAITWWDFADRDAWQRAPAGLLGQDLTPKPAYLALKELVKNRWWTRTQVTTDPTGQARFRGFLGDYQLTLRLDAGREIQVTHTLAAGDGNVKRIVVD